MIQDQYCTLETCQLLKKAGFPQDPQMAALISDFADAPTQAQAMRWLREEHNLFVEITTAEGKMTDMWLLPLRDEGFYYPGDALKIQKDLDSYEAAAEAGIQAACKYLIAKGGEQ